MAAGLLLLILAVLGLMVVAVLVALVVWLVGRTRTPPAAAQPGQQHGGPR